MAAHPADKLLLPFMMVVACCALGSSKSSAQLAPTFERDVQPILARHCQTCHQPGEVAPMSLRSWDETRPWAASIRRAVAGRKMPPWFADEAVGRFSNDRRLSQSEIETLVAWVDNGAPQGEVTVEPPETQDSAALGWQIGQPDLIVSMPEAFLVPAEGVVDYINIKIASGVEEDRWIEAVEVQPGQRSVIHHVDVLVCRPGCPEDQDLAALDIGVPASFPASSATSKPEPSLEAGVSGDDVEFLASFLPGGRPQSLPLGHARLLPAGAEIVLNLHYTPNGVATRDTTSVGFRFAKEPPERRVISFFLDNYSLWVPAGKADYLLETEVQLAKGATLLALTPHMHSRGVAASVEHIAPNDRARPLLRVPRYDFNWQITYELAEPLQLEPGDRLRYRQWYDNSPANLANPDPERDVPWGRQTTDEMSSLFVTVSVPRSVSPGEVFGE